MVNQFTYSTRLFIGLLTLLFLTADVAAQQSDFSKLVVFGDSLSDTGNLIPISLPPPYFENRISDGPVVADLIAEFIGSSAAASGHLFGRTGGFNFAVSGGNIVGSDPEDLNQQVSAYLDRVSNQADPDALYLVFVGGNDLRNLRSIRSASQASAEIAQAVAILRIQLNRLKAAGARAFLIPNVANIGRIPETLQREIGDPGVTVRAEGYTREYNLALSALIGDFSADTNLSVGTFNLFDAFEALIVNASDFGFTNTQEGCFDPDTFAIEPECLIFGFERRVFFDNLHPSSATNRIIAPQVIASIPSLPADQTLKFVIAPILELLLN